MYRIGGWTAKHGISGSNITLAYSGMPNPPSPGDTTELVGMILLAIAVQRGRRISTPPEIPAA